jgi:hypothetical protein
VSGQEAATVDIRKACNTIKRTASLGSISMVTGLDAKAAMEACYTISLEVLKSAGFDVEDQARLEQVMPMVLEASAFVLADAVKNAPGGVFGPKELAAATTLGATALSEVAKSRVVAKVLEPVWPADIDGLTAIRLAAAAAMSLVAVEVAEFDFMHSAAECVREAGKTVVKAAMDACAVLAPARASSAARSTLTQSLINSGARIFAAAWRTEAMGMMAELDAMDDVAAEAATVKMETASIASVLAPVNKRFAEVFAAATDAAMEFIPIPQESAKAAAPASPAKAAASSATPAPAAPEQRKPVERSYRTPR